MRKILFLAARPAEGSRECLSREVREIGEGLQRSHNRDEFELIPRWEVQPRDIQRAMLDTHPQIVHFSGQGVSDDPKKKGLVFNDTAGNPQVVSRAALARLFSLFEGHVECVLMNGCYCPVQAEAIAQHVPFVIGISGSINECAALEFAIGFYDGLAAGKSVADAYKFGCASLLMAGGDENLEPVLVQSSSARPECVVQKNPRKSIDSDIESPFIVGPPITNPRQFFGRERELRRLFGLIKRLPLQNAAIIGPRRAGKTSLLYYLMKICTTPESELSQEIWQSRELTIITLNLSDQSSKIFQNKFTEFQFRNLYFASRR